MEDLNKSWINIINNQYRHCLKGVEFFNDTLPNLDDYEGYAEDVTMSSQVKEEIKKLHECIKQAEDFDRKFYQTSGFVATDFSSFIDNSKMILREFE